MISTCTNITSGQATRQHQIRASYSQVRLRLQQHQIKLLPRKSTPPATASDHKQIQCKITAQHHKQYFVRSWGLATQVQYCKQYFVWLHQQYRNSIQFLGPWTQDCHLVGPVALGPAHPAMLILDHVWLITTGVIDQFLNWKHNQFIKLSNS